MSAKKDQDLNKAKTFLGQVNTKFNDFKASEQDPDAILVLEKVHEEVKRGMAGIDTLIQNEIPDQNQMKVSDLPIQEGSRQEAPRQFGAPKVETPAKPAVPLPK